MPERIRTLCSDDHVLPPGADSREQQEFDRGKQLIENLIARQTHHAVDALSVLSAGHPKP